MDETPVETPQEQVDQPVQDNKPLIDPSLPLHQQADKLIASLPKEEEKPVDTPVEETTEVEELPDEDDEVLDSMEEENSPEPLPDWQKYVLDNLPNIQVMGHEGDKKDKVYNVKRLEDLPDDFEFASKRAELQFTSALASQELNARDLLAKYKQQEQAQSLKEFQNQEAIDVQNDIRALQREKILPKFKYKESDPRFNDDPAVKEAEEIYELYTKTNQEYYNKYANSNRTYRISFRDAADKYYATKARTAPKDTHVEERKKVAEKVSAPQNADPTKRYKGVRPGTTPQDIYRLYKTGRI